MKRGSLKQSANPRRPAEKSFPHVSLLTAATLCGAAAAPKRFDSALKPLPSFREVKWRPPHRLQHLGDQRADGAGTIDDSTTNGGALAAPCQRQRRVGYPEIAPQIVDFPVVKPLRLITFFRHIASRFA